MPGAEMLEKTGDDAYKVAIKVKLGPVSMTYRGDVSIVERDPQAHTARMSVRAKEARGQGTANAEVSIALDEQGEETQARIHANVQLAGKAASLGRGIIDDVSARLVDQSAATLASMLEGAPAETASGAPAGSAAAAGGGGGSRAAGRAAEASGAAGRAASIGNGSAV